MTNDISTFKRQLQQLEELRDAGALTAEQYAQSKAGVERRLLDLVLTSPEPPSDPAPLAKATPPLYAATPDAPVDASQGQPDLGAAAEVAAEPPTDRQSAPPAINNGPARPSIPLMVGLAASVLAVAVAGFWWTSRGSTEQAAVAVPQPEDAAPPHDANSSQMASMVEKLAERLKENPTDAAGWGMLARSYSVLGRTNDAVDAYAKAAALSKDDAGLLTDYADALAVKNNRTLSGEPMKLVERALKIDPRNVKALALSGTDAFNRKDYAAAVKAWDQVVQFAAPDNLFVQQIQSGLVEARQLAGLPPSDRPVAGPSLADFAKGAMVAPLAVASNPKAGPGPSGAMVQGKVSLAPSLASKVAPGDTVFLTARAPTGSRMPLAVIRKQVKDLPLDFVLDDSLAMSPAARISAASSVVVTARVSRNGNAMPQAGDLMGQTAPVAVGTKGLLVEIREPFKP